MCPGIIGLCALSCTNNIPMCLVRVNTPAAIYISVQKPKLSSYQPTADKLRHICTGRLITRLYRQIWPIYSYYYNSVGSVSVFLLESCAILMRRAAPRVVHRVGIPPPPRQSVRLASQATSMCSGTRCFPFSGCHAKKNAVHAKQGNQTVGPIAAIAVEGGARTLVRRFQGARSRDSYDCETGHCKKINKRKGGGTRAYACYGGGDGGEVRRSDGGSPACARVDVDGARVHHPRPLVHGSQSRRRRGFCADTTVVLCSSQ